MQERKQKMLKKNSTILYGSTVFMLDFSLDFFFVLGSGFFRSHVNGIRPVIIIIIIIIITTTIL